MGPRQRTAVNFTEVKLTSKFWCERLRTVLETSIPSQDGSWRARDGPGPKWLFLLMDKIVPSNAGIEHLNAVEKSLVFFRKILARALGIDVKAEAWGGQQVDH